VHRAVEVQHVDWPARRKSCIPLGEDAGRAEVEDILPPEQAARKTTPSAMNRHRNLEGIHHRLE
jgi:hypothetical protein